MRADRLDNTACLEGTVDAEAWRRVMLDLVRKAHRDVVAIYKKLMVEPEPKIGCGLTDEEALELERKDVATAEMAAFEKFD